VDRHVTSTTPATGHDGATATSNAHDTAVTSDNDNKITKYGWSNSNCFDQ
jgi:hypothetical protein